MALSVVSYSLISVSPWKIREGDKSYAVVTLADSKGNTVTKNIYSIDQYHELRVELAGQTSSSYELIGQTFSSYDQKIKRIQR